VAARPVAPTPRRRPSRPPVAQVPSATPPPAATPAPPPPRAALPGPATPSAGAAPVPGTAAPPPPPPPAEAATPPPPPQAAAARASVGEGRSGAVVGAGVPDDGSRPSEPDVTVGGESVSGDAPPPDGDEPPAEAGGSAVPPAVSDAVAAVAGSLPVSDQPVDAAPGVG